MQICDQAYSTVVEDFLKRAVVCTNSFYQQALGGSTVLLVNFSSFRSVYSNASLEGRQKVREKKPCVTSADRISLLE